MTSPYQRFSTIGTTILAAGLVALSPGALGQAVQAWPTKPIHMVVGYPSGSSPDMLARMVAEPLSKALGQPVVVENKPGASGNIGADLVAKATDGHTIGIIGNGPLTSSKLLYSKLPYDPNSDFAPIALIASAPLVWVTAKPATERSVDAFVKQAREGGDKLAYGSVGAGSGGHLGMELIKQALGINPIHVPFGGSPAIVTALLGGQIQMALIPASTIKPLVEAGKLQALAVSTAKPSPLAPTLPAMQDIGAKGINIEVWNAVMAPARMPAANQARLSKELEKILQSRDMRTKLIVQGWLVEDASAKALAKRIRQDSVIYGDLIARNKIQIE